MVHSACFVERARCVCFYAYVFCVHIHTYTPTYIKADICVCTIRWGILVAKGTQTMHSRMSFCLQRKPSSNSDVFEKLQAEGLSDTNSLTVFHHLLKTEKGGRADLRTKRCESQRAL